MNGQGDKPRVGSNGCQSRPWRPQFALNQPAAQQHDSVFPTSTGIWAIIGICLLSLPMSGCAGLRNRLACRSAECTQLCEDARQARELGQADEAEQLLNAAIRRRPTDTQARLDLAEEMWSSGRQIAAADLLTRMVSERPDDAPLILRLAQMEFEIGRTAVAENALRRATQLDPENPEGLRLRAQIAERYRDWDTAVATYHRLIQMLPEDWNAQMAMASVHLQRGQSDRAAPLLRAIIQQPFATAEQRRRAEWQLGLCYVQADRWSDAARCLQSAIDQQRASADDWYQLAYVQSRSGDYDGAYTSVSRALERQPNYNPALILARQIELNEGPSVSAVVPVGFNPPFPVETVSDSKSGPSRL